MVVIKICSQRTYTFLKVGYILKKIVQMCENIDKWYNKKTLISVFVCILCNIKRNIKKKYLKEILS
jgi:hypothetical protein